MSITGISIFAPYNAHQKTESCYYRRMIDEEAQVEASEESPKKRSHRTSLYRKTPATNPYIFTKKSVWMQRVADGVRAGASLYLTGETKLEKGAFLAGKFAARYKMNLTPQTDLAWRKRGKTVTRWIACFDEKSGLVKWVLLCWPGEDQDKSEKWQKVHDNRITHTGYELVRLTKTGAKAPVLTWRYTKKRFEELHDQIVKVIRLRHDVLLEQIIHSLHRSPGFSGVRVQVKKLWEIVRAEWKRTRPRTEPVPEIPKNIGYVRRLPDVGMVWSELMKAGKLKPEGG